MSKWKINDPKSPNQRWQFTEKGKVKIEKIRIGKGWSENELSLKVEISLNTIRTMLGKHGSDKTVLKNMILKLFYELKTTYDIQCELEDDDAECFLKPPPSHLNNIPYPPNPRFVGRKESLEQLRSLLCSDVRTPAAIVGMGGSGKTQLAAEYGHRFESAYSGGIFWFDARDESRLQKSYLETGALLFFGKEVDPIDIEHRVHAQLALQSAPTLLIYDNADENSMLRPLIRLVSDSPKLSLLVTSQRRDAVHKCEIIELPSLTDEEAIKLLFSGESPKNSEEERAAREIVKRVGHLPLALELIASHIKMSPFGVVDYLEQLNADPNKALEKARRWFESETDHIGSVYDTIRLAGTGLNDEADKVLKALACFAPQDVSPSLLCEAAGMKEEEEDEAISELYARSLLKYSKAENSATKTIRLTMHELVGVCIRRRMNDEGLDESMLIQISAALARTLKKANDSMDWRKVHSDILAIRSMIRQYDRLKLPFVDCKELFYELGVYYLHSNDAIQAEAFLEQAAARAGDQYGEKSLEAARFLRLQGENYSEADGKMSVRALKPVRKAWWCAMQALPRSSEGLIEFYWSLGIALRREESFDRALACYLRAQRICETSHGANSSQMAVCWNYLGVFHEVRKDFEQAETCYRKALAIDLARGLENMQVAVHCNNLGRVFTELGNPLEAIKKHKEAGSIYTRIFDSRHKDVGASLCYLGDAYSCLRDDDTARKCYRESVKIFQNFYGENHRNCQYVQARIDKLQEACATNIKPE